MCTQIVGWNTRRNNGVVIGNLRIIEHILRLLELLVRLKQSGCQLLVSSQSPKDIRALGIDVIGKISGIDTRIGCYLLFVEALDELESLVGTESELAVAIDLQGCEVIKSLGTLLSRLLLNIGNCKQTILDSFECSLRLFNLVITTFGAVEGDITIECLEFPILLGDKVDNLEMTLHNHGQSGRLDTTDREHLSLSRLAVTNSVETGGVHAQKPVSDGSTEASHVQPIVLGLKFKMLESFTNGFVGHRIDPQAINGNLSSMFTLDGTRFLHDPTLYQFTLLTGITTVDDALGIGIKATDDFELLADTVVIL